MSKKKTKFKPLMDRVLVKRKEAAAESEGGIVIPEQSRERPMEGTVIAVGSGRRDAEGHMIAMVIKEGDQILFSNYAGTEIKIGNDDFLILTQDDVLGRIN